MREPICELCRRICQVPCKPWHLTTVWQGMLAGKQAKQPASHVREGQHEDARVEGHEDGLADDLAHVARGCGHALGRFSLPLPRELGQPERCCPACMHRILLSCGWDLLVRAAR